MNEYTQDVKIICQNSIIKGSAKAAEGHPWRNWKIKVVAVDNNREKKGKLTYLLDHVEYMLHPTFENPRRVFLKEPYLLQEKGWGEFDMRVVLFFTNNLAEPENIFFDLHFRESTYTILHKIHFQNPSTELIKILSIELPSSDTISTNNTPHNSSTPASAADHNNTNKKRRTTSPSLSSTAKKIKTPPSTSSPFHDPPYNYKYPTSSSPAAASLLNNNDMESDILFRTIHGYNRQDLREGVIIDNVYEEKDLENVNPIHTKTLEDENIRIAWGLPEGLDLLELAKRLSLRTREQTEEIEALIKNHKRDGMTVEENDEEFMVDLYTLGPDLLSKLWDYTETKMNFRPVLSPFSLVQANTAMMEDD